MGSAPQKATANKPGMYTAALEKVVAASTLV